MKIRKFKKEDSKGTWKVIKRAIKVMISQSGEVYSFWDSYYFNPSVLIGLSKLRKIYVAEDKKGIIGTASLDHEFLSSVYVNPKSQGMGVGKRLVERIEKVAKKKRDHIRTVAAKGAVGFYRKLGYKIEFKLWGLIIMEKKF